MLPQGFLGTRGDILMDLVVLSFIVILPVLVISWRAARAGNFSRHRAIQLTLVWLPLLVLSLRRFPSPPASNDFGATHRACGHDAHDGVRYFRGSPLLRRFCTLGS